MMTPYIFHLLSLNLSFLLAFWLRTTYASPIIPTSLYFKSQLKSSYKTSVQSQLSTDLSQIFSYHQINFPPHSPIDDLTVLKSFPNLKHSPLRCASVDRSSYSLTFIFLVKPVHQNSVVLYD